MFQQERGKRRADGVRRRVRRRDDAQPPQQVQLGGELRLDRGAAGAGRRAAQAVARDEAAQLAAPAAQQPDVVRRPFERLVHDEDDAADGERLGRAAAGGNRKGWLEGGGGVNRGGVGHGTGEGRGRAEQV